jgi:hypothetical protein
MTKEKDRQEYRQTVMNIICGASKTTKKVLEHFVPGESVGDEEVRLESAAVGEIAPG